MNKWVTIVPIHNFWQPPSTLPFRYNDNLSISAIPIEFRNDDDNDLFRKELIEAIDGVENCFLYEYEAPALDASQNQATIDIAWAYISLWLIRGTELYFDKVAHIQKTEDGWLTRSIGDLDRFLCAPESRNVELEDADFQASTKLHEILTSLEPSTALYTTLDALVRGLTESKWEWRFIILWVGMEALYGSSSHNEITFRLSQRVGLFLGNDVEESKAIFSKTKQSYNYRSKAVHGLQLKTLKSEYSIELMSELENVLRKSILKIISNSYLLNIFISDSRETYLEELAFKGHA